MNIYDKSRVKLLLAYDLSWMNVLVSKYSPYFLLHHPKFWCCWEISGALSKHIVVSQGDCMGQNSVPFQDTTHRLGAETLITSFREVSQLQYGIEVRTGILSQQSGRSLNTVVIRCCLEGHSSLGWASLTATAKKRVKSMLSAFSYYIFHHEHQRLLCSLGVVLDMSDRGLKVVEPPAGWVDEHGPPVVEYTLPVSIPVYLPSLLREFLWPRFLFRHFG